MADGHMQVVVMVPLHRGVLIMSTLVVERNMMEDLMEIVSQKMIYQVMISIFFG